MKKRILSIILIFAMIITMIPQTVLAESQVVAEGYLAYRYAHFDEDYFLDYDEPLRTTHSSRRDITSEVYFFYVEGDTETPILASEIYSSNENILEARDVDDYLVSLVPQGYGTTTINYKKDGKLYSISSEVQLEDYGYCTSPELTTDSIVQKFSVAEVGDKLYFATRDGYEFDEVELLEEFQNIATAEISDDKTYITITFKAIPDNNEIYELGASYVIDEESSHHAISPIILFDGTPGLRYREASWSEENQSYYANPESELLDTWKVEPGSRSSVVFYYIEKGVETEIPLEDLTISDSSVVSLSEEWGGGAFAIESLDFGHATIGYKKDGVEYTVDINVELPTIAFYTEPKASEDAYIQKFTVTKEKNTFYYVAKEDWIIAEFEMQGSCQEYATVTLSEDNTYLTIQMDEDAPNGWFGFFGTVENEYTMEGHSGSIDIISGKPALVYKNIWMNGDEYEEDTGFCHDINLEHNNGMGVHFYFKEGENATSLSVSDLTSADESIVVIEEYDNSPDYVHIKAVGAGETEIRYTVDGKTYSIPIVIDLPIFGFYSEPEANVDTIINEFDLTENTNEFYVVAKDGWKITDFTLEYDSEDYLTETLSVDGTYVKLTVADDSPSEMCYMSVTGYHEEYQENYSDLLYTKINNNLPGLRIGYYYYNGDEIFESETPLASKIEIEPGWSTLIGFYYFENGEKTLLKSGDIEISDESIVYFDQFRENESLVYLEAAGCGEATISYAVNGKTYSIKVIVNLPDFGFFSSPNASAETYITDFVRYKEQDTFYFVARNGWKLLDVRVEEYFEEVAEITIDPLNGAFAAIKIDEDFEDFYAYLSYDAINEELQETVEDYGWGINIENGNPDLKFRYGALVDGEFIGEEESSYFNTLWTILGETEYVYLYYVENGEGTRVKYNQVTSSNESVVKVKECEYDNRATELEIVGVGSATINYKLNGVTYSLLVSSELPISGFFSTKEFDVESYITEFEVTDTKKIFYLMTSEDYRFGNVTLVGNAAEYAEIKPLANNQIIEITISDDFEGEKYLKIEAVIDVPMYDYSFEECFGITVYNDEPTILTGWQFIDGDWYFYNNDGKKVTNQWKEDSKGWCFLGEDGAMLTNQWVKDSVGYCFVDKSGYMVYNQWCEDEKGLAYAGIDGYRQTEKWIQDSKGWSYVDENGYKVYDKWVSDCYIDDTGYMVVSKWVETDDGWCYTGSNGYKTTNQWIQRDGKWVYLGADGYAVTKQWRKDSTGWCYLDENGFMVYEQWVEDSTGLCYVGKTGYMVTNQWVEHNGQWCYVGVDGYKVTKKWVKDSKGWCYLNEEGYMLYEQWVEDSTGLCYVGADGYMVTNQWIDTEDGWHYINANGYVTTDSWIKKSGEWCYLGSDGYIVTNDWAKDGSRWCYLDENGHMTKDTWINGDDGSCYLDANGYMATNQWLKLDNEWVYVGSNGYMLKNAWAKDSKGWCYLDENGHMVLNDWVPDSKGEVYLDSSGYMVTNKWIQVEDKWCYVGSDGYKVTSQWRKDSKGWCYLGEDGFMLTSQWVKDSVGYCYVDEGGYIVYSQWVESDGNKYYVNSSGYRVENAWIQLEGKWYYFKEEGIMAKEETIDGYRVDKNGVWIQE